eukprot:g1386.t1
MKYRAAATLGEVVACTGNLLSSGEGERSRWQFELSDAADPSRVFVSAEAVVSWPGGVALPPGTRVGAPSGERTTARAESQLLQPLPEAFADSRKSLEVVVWSDDLDGGGELSIRAVLNYFLRMTTLRIGRGPDGELGLMRLHREGVSMVVANISDLRVNSKDVAAGDKLDVRQSFTALTRTNSGASYRPRASSSPAACSSSPSTTYSTTCSASADGEALSLPFRHCNKVYIEMTDMYGIVYHANYVTYFKRAIEDACGAPGALIHALHSMKYRAAATLGEVVACTGNLLSSGEGERSRWKFELSDAADPSRVFVSAEAVVSWPGGVALPPGTRVGAPSGERTTARAESQLLQPLPEAFADSRKSLEVVVWSDDLDGGGGELSIRAVLNYFERIRTLSLGSGPDGELGLMRLHREGVSVVVTSISDLRVNSNGVAAGDKLDVRLGVKLSRGNRVMTMYESLWTKGDDLVAHAEISLFCMDNESRKFRAVPPWVQEALFVPSAAADNVG